MPDPIAPPRPRWQRAGSAVVRAVNAYGRWLAGIGWWKFLGLSVLLLVIGGILQNVPPFTWRLAEYHAPPPVPPKPPKAPSTPGAQAPGAGKGKVEITIDERGVRVIRGAAPAASAASAPASAPAEPDTQVEIRLPPGATSETVREAVDEARQAIREALEEAQQEAEAARVVVDAPRERLVVVRLGDSLPQLTVIWVLLSAILKIVYAGRVRAEVTAAAATETAEAEALRRQVSEARMAAMQAQVEPHFLFNTLASIDHLIETDPARASAMQKHLIALLRARMPAMRDPTGHGVRPLGQELAVIEPYLELLKMRMEDRLQTTIDVPEGLRSAEFPPMMVQGLVENAIKHGLEPKPDGGHLAVKAEIVHGKLVVSVADTGLGFGRGGTSGTGTGLANIRERLALLYGSRASLVVAENQPTGTRVVITVPYTAHEPVPAGARA